MTLQPSLPGEMTAELPYILFLPVENYKINPKDYQVRPLSLTAGSLETGNGRQIPVKRQSTGVW